MRHVIFFYLQKHFKRIKKCKRSTAKTDKDPFNGIFLHRILALRYYYHKTTKMEQETKNTALLVMDMQQGILGGFPGAGPLIAMVAKAIAEARDKKIPVIYVVIGFRKGLPEVSRNNKSFSARKQGFASINMDEFMKVHPEIAPREGEVTVTKRRVSAFTGSDLEVILRSLDIQHLILTGIATSGVVLATLIEAADKDYRLTVLTDCCADGEEEVHRILTTNIFARRANVLTCEDWCKT